MLTEAEEISREIERLKSEIQKVKEEQQKQIEELQKRIEELETETKREKEKEYVEPSQPPDEVEEAPAKTYVIEWWKNIEVGYSNGFFIRYDCGGNHGNQTNCCVWERLRRLAGVFLIRKFHLTDVI